MAQREIRYLISRGSMEGREIRDYIITRSSIMKGETMFQKKKKITRPPEDAADSHRLGSVIFVAISNGGKDGGGP